MRANTDISVIIPAKDEAESLPELCTWIHRIMQENNFRYEVIIIDDGSQDESWNVISFISRQNPAIKGIRFNRNYGKSAALDVGFKAATGNVVITMDADLQDSPGRDTRTLQNDYPGQIRPGIWLEKETLRSYQQNHSFQIF
jgi:glycosyltransferase involved in cell wall biosynthesis